VKRWLIWQSPSYYLAGGDLDKYRAAAADGPLLRVCYGKLIVRPPLSRDVVRRTEANLQARYTFPERGLINADDFDVLWHHHTDVLRAG
jgi:hypothetical protein